MDPISKFFETYPVLRRFVIFAVLGLVLYLTRSVFNILILTFIFTYLLYSLQTLIVKQLGRFVRIGPKIVIILLYALLGAGIVFAAVKYIPVLVKEVIFIINRIWTMYKVPGNNAIAQFIVSMLHKIDLAGYIDQNMDTLVKSAGKIGILGVDVVLSFILSLFFQLEKNRVFKFTSGFEKSRVASIYHEIVYFGKKFTHSFGKVMQAQILIALVNCLLSAVGLSLLGFHKVFGLALMIFLLGLIPVAGMIISLIPLSMIAFNLGGVEKVIGVLVMIIILHALEAYILNPRLMSAKTDVPIFYIFMVLIIGEQFLGPWGLIIGVPLFIFILDIFEVPYEKEKKPVTESGEPLLKKIFKKKKE